MKYVQKERGVAENEMGGESWEKPGGKKVSGCVCVCACGCGWGRAGGR